MISYGGKLQGVSILTTMFWLCESQGKGTDATKESFIKEMVSWHHNFD